MREKLNQFLNSSKDYPVLLGLASGLQPLLYLYHKNFNLVNSWPQFVFLATIFILLPIVVFFTTSYVTKSVKSIEHFKSRFLSILNFCLFTFFVVYVTYGINKITLLLISLCVAFVLGLVLHKHLKKIVIFQLLLASVVSVKIVQSVYYKSQYSYEWQNQPDNIKDVVFKKRPNIYYLQPDGYVDFSQISKGYYQFDNSNIASFLSENQFIIYDNFRSNYRSTLTTNCAIFSMKHHYYCSNQNLDRFYNSREIIAGKNPVIDIFKKNNYKTNLILDAPYLVANRPNILYDFCNVENNEIAYLPRGFEFEKDTQRDLLDAIDKNGKTNSNFYFVRQPYPGHIQTRKAKSKGKELEREDYLKDLKISNEWLKNVTNEIVKRDPNSLIIISSDHGGYVGFDYMRESIKKITDKDLLYSMFSSVLAIRWPEDNTPDYTASLKSSVNIFRVLFSYLSENEHYLKNLESDASYGLVKEDAPSGTYELINDKGEVVFNRFSD